MARLLRRAVGDRRDEAAADHVDAERPRLVAVDEGADIRAGADEEDTLGRKRPGGAGERGDAHDHVTQHDQRDQRRDVEQHAPAARILAAGLGEEAEHQQADQRDVPQLDGAPGMRLEVKEVGQPVFAAEKI
jgi:hypothetical protein